MPLDGATKASILRKLNAKAFAMFGALLLICTGSFMIFKGIKDQGSIDLKAPFLTGKVESGFVGITLIVAAVFIILAVLYYRAAELKNYPKQSVTVRRGRVDVKWEGALYEMEDYKYLHRLLQGLMEQSNMHTLPEKNQTDEEIDSLEHPSKTG
jgi:hypothetical protein